jgi:altronate dehydratase large subunit
MPLREDIPGFAGYPRPDGTVGIRNHVLVLSLLGLTNPSARRIQRAVSGTVLVATPYGRCQYGEDSEIHRRQLLGLALNPNVAAVLLVGADRKTMDGYAASIAASGRPVELAALDDTHEDHLALTDRGIRSAARLVRDASRLVREPVALRHLFVGVECGHSDATSGLASNPVAGRAVDRVIAAGGSAVFGETIEWLGAEHVLAERAASAAVAERIVAAVARRERAVAASGLDLLGNNPGQENIRGGLSTIEEKSLGAVAKGGSATIVGVLGIAERPARAGLHVMDAPAFSPESMTGFAAAGVQVMLFTTGHGNSFCNLLAPTIKISSHPAAVARLTEQIDFDGSDVLRGAENLDRAGNRLVELVRSVASGQLTWGEILDEGEEAFVRVGASF